MMSMSRSPLLLAICCLASLTAQTHALCGSSPDCNSDQYCSPFSSTACQSIGNVNGACNASIAGSCVKGLSCWRMSGGDKCAVFRKLGEDCSSAPCESKASKHTADLWCDTLNTVGKNTCKARGSLTANQKCPTDPPGGGDLDLWCTSAGTGFFCDGTSSSKTCIAKKSAYAGTSGRCFSYALASGQGRDRECKSAGPTGASANYCPSSGSAYASNSCSSSASPTSTCRCTRRKRIGTSCKESSECLWFYPSTDPSPTNSLRATTFCSRTLSSTAKKCVGLSKIGGWCDTVSQCARENIGHIYSCTGNQCRSGTRAPTKAPTKYPTRGPTSSRAPTPAYACKYDKADGASCKKDCDCKKTDAGGAETPVWCRWNSTTLPAVPGRCTRAGAVGSSPCNNFYTDGHNGVPGYLIVKLDSSTQKAEAKKAKTVAELLDTRVNGQVRDSAKYYERVGYHWQCLQASGAPAICNPGKPTSFQLNRRLQADGTCISFKTPGQTCDLPRGYTEAAVANNALYNAQCKAGYCLNQVCTATAAEGATCSTDAACGVNPLRTLIGEDGTGTKLTGLPMACKKNRNKTLTKTSSGWSYVISAAVSGTCQKVCASSAAAAAIATRAGKPCTSSQYCGINTATTFQVGNAAYFCETLVPLGGLCSAETITKQTQGSSKQKGHSYSHSYKDVCKGASGTTREASQANVRETVYDTAAKMKTYRATPAASGGMTLCIAANSNSGTAMNRTRTCISIKSPGQACEGYQGPDYTNPAYHAQCPVGYCAGKTTGGKCTVLTECTYDYECGHWKSCYGANKPNVGDKGTCTNACAWILNRGGYNDIDHKMRPDMELLATKNPYFMTGFYSGTPDNFKCSIYEAGFSYATWKTHGSYPQGYQRDFFCESNSCVKKNPVGGSCALDMGCQKDLFCFNNLCSASLAVGSKCERDAQCANNQLFKTQEEIDNKEFVVCEQPEDENGRYIGTPDSQTGLVPSVCVDQTVSSPFAGILDALPVILIVLLVCCVCGCVIMCTMKKKQKAQSIKAQSIQVVQDPVKAEAAP